MFIIDRFEGDFAVVEYMGGEILHLPRFILPEHAKEGDVISISITVEIDKDETSNRRKKIEDLMDDLFD